MKNVQNLGKFAYPTIGYVQNNNITLTTVELFERNL